MRVIMVGCGRIAQIAHLVAIDRVESVELVAVVDPSAELGRRVAQRWGGVPSFTATADAYRDIVADAVVLAVPDRMHAPLAREAMDAGLHVLVEKPLAGGISDAEAMRDAAVETGRVLRVGNMRRHDPGVVRAHEAVRDRIGEIISFSAWYRPSIFDTDEFWQNIIKDPQITTLEAGFKSDKDRYWPYTYGSHLWDTVRFVLGDVASVTTSFHRIGTHASWQSLIALRGGAIGTADLTCYEHGDGGEGLHVRGTEGTVTLDLHNPFLWRAADVSVHTDADRLVHVSPLTYANAYERQLRSFEAAVAAVTGTGDAEGTWGRPATPDDGVRTVRLIEAMRQSVDTGARVELS
ncbi:Gfo/Idh/MocA family protein [Microbacterium sp.]|uniref:Gfo/Idh/MocA family protein n=1 Tax=Microbacterium sp. TaxID=51671 RepID=UPI0039E2C5AE